MAEAILRHLGGDRFEAFSAGSYPAGFVHGLAVDAMQHMNIPMDERQHTSKSWNEFADQPMDIVITVCDAAAAETCPAWPGDPICVHWSLPDPAMQLGSEEDRLELALRVAERLQLKIEGLVDLDWSMDRTELTRRLGFLGEI